MSKKTILSIALIVLGVSIGLLVIFAYSMSGGKTALALPFLAVAILCIITGSILQFSRLLDRLVGPALDEIHIDLEDDIQDLKEHRITNAVRMFILTGIAALVFSFLVFRLHKLEAMWGPIPVALPTLAGMGVLAWFIPRTHWFRYYREYTPMWAFSIPTAGLVLTLVIGLAKTENMRVITATPQESIEYNSSQYTGFFFQEVANVGVSRLELDVPSCDGDGCAVVMVIALVILTFILLIGSAFIPHFWLFSGSIFLGIMMLIAIHDLRIRRSYGEAS